MRWKWHYSKTEMRAIFWQTKTHVKSMGQIRHVITVHWHFNDRLCCVHWYLRWYHGTKHTLYRHTTLHRLYVCVKWFLTVLSDKKTLISVFFYIFDATFTAFSLDITFSKCLQLNSLYCPVYEKKMAFYLSLYWTTLCMYLARHSEWSTRQD